MPVGLQSKILRSIQESKVRRVGALKEIETDLKIISSVNTDPHAAIADKTLRSDLFYRLAVVFIHIVPLRERMGDIDLLVEHFIEKHNAMLCKNVKRVSSGVMDLFESYDWPGNVRELEHVIEGAMNIVGTNEVIRVRHLQAHFSSWSSKTKSAKNKFAREPGLMIKKTAHEESIIRQAIAENKGNITRTARSLGISRQLLYYKLKKFNIPR